MKVIIRKQTDLVAGRWNGRTTTELAIYPETASYKERDFIWRVSTATVEQEESDFTKLVGFRRIILSLQGDLSLYHHLEATNKAIYLKPYEPYAFDGAWDTTSKGKVVDFNLMLSGKADGTVRTLGDSENQTIIEMTTPKGKREHFVGFYTWKTPQKIHISGRELEKEIDMREKEFLLIQAFAGECATLRIDPVADRNGCVIMVEVFIDNL